MGTSAEGIAIKIDTSNIQLEKVVQDLFGKEFKKINHHCDARQYNCVYIGKSNNCLVIVHFALANKFFENQNTDVVKPILDYFSNPALVFAFEHYDSGGTYSYALIYNGVLTRQLRSFVSEVVINYGTLEALEVKWQNAIQTEIPLDEDEPDEGMEILLTDPESGETCTESRLPEMLVQDLMFQKFGFTAWNMNDYFVEEAFFKK